MEVGFARMGPPLHVGATTSPPVVTLGLSGRVGLTASGACITDSPLTLLRSGPSGYCIPWHLALSWHHTVGVSHSRRAIYYQALKGTFQLKVQQLHALGLQQLTHSAAWPGKICSTYSGQNPSVLPGCG